MLHLPLKNCRITQPFAVNYVGGDFYSKIGLDKGHNGLDFSAVSGTEVFAVMDGDLKYTKGGTGYGNEIRIRAKDSGLEVVYGHLKTCTVPDGEVKKGALIGLSNNTGYSTGDHLHFGIRQIFYHTDGSGPYVKNYDNGFFGYIDPSPFFDFSLPVDRQYGLTNQTPGVPSEITWQVTNIWFFKTFRRLMTTRERNAFRYGFWDVRTVLDPAMFDTWTQMIKPAAIKAGIIKQV